MSVKVDCLKTYEQKIPVIIDMLKVLQNSGITQLSFSNYNLLRENLTKQ